MRATFKPTSPLHVTWRIADGVRSLRRESVLEVVRTILGTHANGDHARALTRPLEVRNVLRYVLLNARHHAAERGEKLYRDWVDPFSSAPWFDGWKAPVRGQHDWLVRLRKQPRPTAQPRTWLLRLGWRKHGLLAFDEVPGDAR